MIAGTQAFRRTAQTPYASSSGDPVATPSVRQRGEARIAQNRAVLPQKPGTAKARRRPPAARLKSSRAAEAAPRFERFEPSPQHHDRGKRRGRDTRA